MRLDRAAKAMSNIFGVMSMMQRAMLIGTLMACGLAASISSTSMLVVTAFHLPPSSEPWSRTAVLASANHNQHSDHQAGTRNTQPSSSRRIDLSFDSSDSAIGRRDAVLKSLIGASSVFSAATGAAVWSAAPATSSAAKPDCYTDCFQNCQALAPKDLDYCRVSCLDYCQQPDREDGLSGSVSAAKGETGILGGSFGQGTVPKGQDKPPSLLQFPGLDFSSATGRKLIGY